MPAAFGSASTLTVDQGTSCYQLMQVAFALRHPETTTVPIGSEPVLAVGDVLIWDTSQANQLFNAMKTDQPLPREPDHRLEGRTGQLGRLQAVQQGNLPDVRFYATCADRRRLRTMRRIAIRW